MSCKSLKSSGLNKSQHILKLPQLRKNTKRYYCKFTGTANPLWFNQTWILADVGKNSYRISQKSVQQMPSCSTHSDITKQTVPFDNSANVLKNQRSGNEQLNLHYGRAIKKWVIIGQTLKHIYTFRDTQCCSTDCLLMHRCQLYMFQTVTVHPQELLFRCCMCRLWYVVRTALSDTSRWYNVWGKTATLYISLKCIYIAKNDTRTFRCQPLNILH